MTLQPRAARLDDPQWIALAWYGQTLERLLALTGLVPAGEIASSEPALSGVASGHVVAFSDDWRRQAPSGNVVVVGGPCIGDCSTFPTLEALHDTVSTVVIGQALGARVLLYLGDREEMLERGGEGKWGKVAERMAAWLSRLQVGMGWKDVHVVRTTSQAHEDALDAAGHPAAGVDPAELDAAFHLGAGTPPAQEEKSRAVTRRVIEAHLPAVVGRHVGARAAPHVVIAENLQQSGVFKVAARLAAAAGERVSFAGYWPAPGLSATERMYRSPEWDKLPAWSLTDLVDGGVIGASPVTRQFFDCWLTPELRRALAAAARPEEA